MVKNLEFKICKVGACGISITGLETEFTWYPDNSTTTTYKYEDCVTINTLTEVDSEGNLKNTKYVLNLHNSEIDETITEFPKDGLFLVSHMIIPTKEWYNSLEPQLVLQLSSIIYVFDKNSSKVYNTLNEEVLIATLLELSDTNDLESLPTTVYKDSQYTFCTCRLQECYYNFCKAYFSKICSNKCVNEYNVERDMLWLGINSIKYLLDLGRYYEAQRLLETISGCTGICKQNINVKSLGYGCGCSN